MTDQHEHCGCRGGQGREAAETTESAWAIWFMVIGAICGGGIVYALTLGGVL